jgi:hypothetical protein
MRTALPAVAAALALAVVPACAGDARAGERVRTAKSPPLLATDPGPRATLLADPRVAGRVGAVQVEVRLRNDGSSPLAVVPDPWLAEVALSGAAGDVRCTPGEPRVRGARAVALEPGASLPLRVDLSARCELQAPGAYELEVSFPAVDAPTPRASVRLDVAPRTWVNPGPR